ncbi:MAG: PAS domain-containing sensor histidine kinase [Acidobacteriota bacterium]|nr:PAS domain-containing sensor histidine kinase [Acidobacteriota bacterium]
MQLRTKLVLAITSLVFLISGALSVVFIRQMLHYQVQQSYDTNKVVASEVRFAVQNALETGLKDREVNPNDEAQLRSLAAEAIRNSRVLAATLDSVNRYSFTVYDVNIGDAQGKTLVSTNPDNQDKPMPQRSDYAQLLDANFVQLLREVYGDPRVFDVSAPLERNGEPFISVRVGVSTALLGAVYKPWISETRTLMGFALITALLVAFFLSNLVLRPFEAISLELEYLTTAAGEAKESEENGAKDARRQDAAQRVTTQIQQIGQRMRNVEEVFSALKENLDQILGNLQDGIVLLTRDGRAVLVSEAARRLLQIKNGDGVGMQADEIFDSSNVLGAALKRAYDAGEPMGPEEMRTESGRRVQVSLDFIQDDKTRQGLGALVTMHDLESVEEIESELELSRRMAAIGRLTSGVGHEVKNPINAIVVHLELLKNKISSDNSPATRHLDVIESEIRRLDRVVQTLVDFSRPVELHFKEQDLRNVVGDVLALSAEELTRRNVTVESVFPSNPQMVNIDADLIKQAVINVVENGAQAMPDGGKLHIQLEEDRKSAVLRIRDEGQGIPAEILEKIFDLYFTTKSTGSGIGLAMTYRILQLHNGSVEVESEEGRGTEFRFRIPLAATEWGRRHLQPAVLEKREGIQG